MNSFAGYTDPKTGECMWLLRLDFTLNDRAVSMSDPASPLGLHIIDCSRSETRCTAARNCAGKITKGHGLLLHGRRLHLT